MAVIYGPIDSLKLALRLIKGDFIAGSIKIKQISKKALSILRRANNNNNLQAQAPFMALPIDDQFQAIMNNNDLDVNHLIVGGHGNG
jgi:hypothetical protein